MQPGIWQILIVALVVLVLFGRGRISEMMGDFGKGISSFKKGMTEENRASSEVNPQIEAPATTTAPTTAPAASETTESQADKPAS
ncbi:twin-arginine translocase TatA/TatE family subunit [Aurantiacibacter marinus]|uniref:Sec-independent protein translocase protein TatA n=1 Tax=Aurantiacibacter marinus TaxID=874156 RepID=A0A0H0XNQ1_9SPHN|nr:twin-arginine translocase TatA/TatE family subunit [Aurantiacibacter marinus]KLI64243.1 preprotein translocase subunit TatA [Aurantiacibacter marinus]